MEGILTMIFPTFYALTLRPNATITEVLGSSEIQLGLTIIPNQRGLEELQYLMELLKEKNLTEDEDGIKWTWGSNRNLTIEMSIYFIVIVVSYQALHHKTRGCHS